MKIDQFKNQLEFLKPYFKRSKATFLQKKSLKLTKEFQEMSYIRLYIYHNEIRITYKTQILHI
jgi:hypothetical protein